MWFSTWLRLTGLSPKRHPGFRPSNQKNYRIYIEVVYNIKIDYFIYCTDSTQKNHPITGQIPLDAQAVFRRFSRLEGAASGAAEGTGLCWPRGIFAFLEGLPLAAFPPLGFLPPSPELCLPLFFFGLPPLTSSSFRSLASCLPRMCFSQGWLDFTGFIFERVEMNLLTIHELHVKRSKGLTVFLFLACSGLPMECWLCTLEAACGE